MAKDLTALHGLVVAMLPGQMLMYKYQGKKYFIASDKALNFRRDLCTGFKPGQLRALQKPPRRGDSTFSMMELLFRCGIRTNPLTGQPIFDPSTATKEQLAAFHEFECDFAAALNNSSGDPQSKLLEAANRLRDKLAAVSDAAVTTDETQQRRKRKRLAPPPTDRVTRSRSCAGP